MSGEYARGAEAADGSTPIAGNDGSISDSNAGSPQAEHPRVPHIRIVPHILDVRKDLYFEVMDRDVPESTILKVGRFTEKVSQQMSRIAFKSKVVSRSHAEVWSEGGRFYIRDTKSSSGTFLNHIRLSPPGVESPPHPLHDGDILQLGVDYQGGAQDIYKCVKIRLEINRTWQRSKENPFRRKMMDSIQNAYHSVSNAAGAEANNECCICLYQMVAFQALFLAPCSHCFHYKCVKPILFTNTSFSCPLCRTYADLEASVTIDENEMDVDSKPPALALALAPPSQSQQSQQPQSQQQPQTDADYQAAAMAAAEAAVRAAEQGGPGLGSAGGAAMAVADATAERDDANATPVPNEQANVDSFGTTPVGSMPTSLAPFGSPGVGAGASHGDADASLVAGGAAHRPRGSSSSGGSGSGDHAMQMVSSPALPASEHVGADADADACNQRRHLAAHASPQPGAN
ncbi:hypothetical protein LPJ61_004171 [Coemansia biformis]|uniref:SMAD/FHA domain-containing protein n=1 Tax=Coemansia biformis TaxID=1286918 RepID=A0A9W7Y9U1_9FUNG|nr:hypothetical protein LPJ61_004171 [Coemansia biformis]